MYADIVVGGKFGLHGYYDELVVYILDLMSLSEPRHEEFINCSQTRLVPLLGKWSIISRYVF